VGVALRGRRAATRCPSVARDPSASLRLLLPLGEFFKPRALPLYLRSALPCWARSRSLARSPAAAPRPQRELSGLARPCDTTAARTASPRKPKARREARAPARDAKWTPSGAPRVPRDHHARVKRTSREEWEVLRQGGHSASRAVREVERPGRPPVVSSSPLPARLRGREPFASRFAAEARPSSHSAAGGQTRWQRCRKQLLQPLVGRRLKAAPRPPQPPDPPPAAPDRSVAFAGAAPHHHNPRRALPEASIGGVRSRGSGTEQDGSRLQQDFLPAL